MPEEKEENESPLNKDKEKIIVNQVDTEFILSWEHTQSKRTESLKRLKLFNNQKRDKAKVGDPLLFTVFQTVLAELYTDRLSSVAQGAEEGDDDAAESLTAMMEFDHGVMEKDELDYEWDWDTCFFGRGFLFLNEFDRDKNVPVSEVIDPMIMIRDPRATSMNGNQKGMGKARFWGREVGLTEGEMKNNGDYFNLDNLKKDKDDKSMSDEARSARREAQGKEDTKYKEEALDENYEYQLLEWWTHVDGKKVVITLANNRKLVVRYKELKEDKWPVIDRVLFPMAHEWDGVSIPDLIEDKQRARSVMINLGMESAKADLYPMYLFNKKKIPVEQNLDFEFNKMIPINGDTANAMTPIQKSVFHQQVNLILNILDTAAQKSVAAPEVAQGVQPGKERTLGETELVMAGKNVRHSLSAKIWGWSEKRFWQQWYWIYKRDFKDDIGKKLLRIQGPLNVAWRELTKENFITEIDPDFFIESMEQVEMERQVKFRDFSAFAQIAMQDPNTNRQYILRKLGKISRATKAELMLMFPQTIDELRAEDENKKIELGKLPKIDFYDDDIVHMEIHNKSSNNAAKIAHIEAHKVIMFIKKKRPELMPMPEEPGQKEIGGYSPVNAGNAQQASAPRAMPDNNSEQINAKV
jgi:hypothetical protein